MNTRKTFMLALVAVFLVIGFAQQGHATLSAVGPVNPGFPSPVHPTFYQDATGMQLQPCLDFFPPTAILNPCVPFDLPNPAAPLVFPTNFPVEFFYYIAEPDFTNTDLLGNITQIRFMLEGGFALGPPAPGDAITFSRLRIRITGLVPGTPVTLTNPFGPNFNFVANVDGNAGTLGPAGQQIGGIDFPANPVAGDFVTVLQTPQIGPVLMRQTGPAPGGPQYIGDFAISGQTTPNVVMTATFTANLQPDPLLPPIPQDVSITNTLLPGGPGMWFIAGKLNAPLPPAGAGLRDFNGDNQDDILWHNQATGAVAVWLMTGTTFTAAAPIATVDPALGWQIVGIGDFNGDGNPDILWRNINTGVVAVWAMNGTTFSAVAPIATVAPATGWTVAGVGDFNADGNQDIVWSNTTTGEVSVWLMTGTTFGLGASIANVGPASPWTIAGIADFNGDNNPDILFRNTITGDVSVWLMAGTAFSSGVSVATVPPASGWTITGTGDFNADLNTDILWRSTTTGAVAAWLMTGTAFSSGVTLGTVVDLNWRIEN